MKAKISNKLNIVLIAITVLLLFVACVSAIGKTGSWLVDDDEMGFQLTVQNIDIEIKQGTRVVSNGGYIYLGTNLIEPDIKYLTSEQSENVTIKNNETGYGYYIRFKAIIKADGIEYNVNQFVTTTDFYDHADDGQDWFYSVKVTENGDGSKTYTNRQMNASETLVLMEDLKFSQDFLNNIQGQLITLHLIIEGSATDSFDNV